MSGYIPFEMQSEIMKRLPVKSLVQSRSVSKQWKSFIDCPEFIKKYHINHSNPKHHLLVRYNRVQTYTSIIDDYTFPQQKFLLAAPEPLKLLRYARVLGSVDGLLCFHGWYKDNKMIVIWNPCIRKSVAIPIRNAYEINCGYSHLGFGVCPDTNDPKLVKIDGVKTPSICWEVQVFTLSSRVWKTVYTGAPFTSYHLYWDHVFIDGIIYWCSSGSFIISFDLKSEKFGEVCIPERLVIPSSSVRVVKVNGSLGLLDCNIKGEMWVCDVWMSKHGVNKQFTNIYTIKVEGKPVLYRVLGFRNNGEVVLQLDDDDFEKSQVEVYEPSSGRLNSVGISGENATFSVWSHMETLLLLDESTSIIH